jgi:flagellar hook-associated protein 2
MAPINFSGIVSGLDSSAIIKATIEQQKALRVAPIERRNTELSDQSKSLNELNKKLKAFDAVSQKFRVLNGGGVNKTSSSSNESVLSVSASTAAQSGSYSINVTSLAKNASVSFSDRFASATSVINSSINNNASEASRTVTFNVGIGQSSETVSVVLSNTTTVDNFISSFNSASTSARAELINVGTSGDPSYAVLISSKNSGTESGSLSVGVGSEISSAGSGAFTANTLSQATNASLSISGLSGTISRSSNSISDLLPGVTLQLSATGTSNISIASDITGTSSKIESFVTAYNDLVTFINSNNSITSTSDENGEIINTFGSLSNTQIDNTLLSQIRGVFTNSTSQSSGSVRILADIGVTSKNRDGTLVFNKTDAENALAKDSSAVQKLFEQISESLSNISTGVISIATRFNGTIERQINTNSESIQQNSYKISDVLSSISKQEQSMLNRFSKLEGLFGKLQQQQNSISALLGGLLAP